ncbi:helix-turn-helix domain-containing protein [Salinibaculum salinum]|uniref:helix-turn-helix domain-containing protein n=1 Tax=Salinibaculum salinum TaxID=3131996 RepID=UPI0030EEA277
MSEEDAQSETGEVTRVEFAFDDGPYPFVSASETLGCTFELAEMIPHGNGRYAEFFNVSGTDSERVLAASTSHEAVEATLLNESENGGLFEFIVGDHCPAATLAEDGALPREVHSEDGDGRIVAEVPPQYDTTAIIDEFLDENPDGELVCKREQESFTPIFSESTLQQMLHAHLTDRQREVLQAAFDAGYYEWPRECTGEEIAAELEISSATLSEHIHAAERNLLAALISEQ